jgi:hypothetical protein
MPVSTLGEGVQDNKWDKDLWELQDALATHEQSNTVNSSLDFDNDYPLGDVVCMKQYGAW